jgi:hypothetical protein
MGNAYNGPNDPRFQQNSGFLEMVGIGAGAGTFAGYLTAWEAIGLYKTHEFLAPDTLFAAIHAAGILPHAYLPILAAGAGLGAIAGAVAGWRGGNIPHEIHVRGSQLTSKPRILQKAIIDASPPANGKNAGIRIHPRIQTTEHLEASHMLVVGGSGAGKTTILWPMIQQIAKRGDKMMIFSFKGDFEQKIDARFALLAPWDTRSGIWRLGEDIRTRLDAESLSMTLIPEADGGDKDPMWSNGSRSLLVGIISAVQREYGENWGFSELAKRCAEALADFAVLKAIIDKENPVAAALLAGGVDSKTTSSFLAVIASYLTQVINLGVGEDSLKGTAACNRKWSVNAWLAGDVPAISILGFRPSAKGLSRAWGASIIEQIVQKCGDLPDVEPDKRRIWLILDEVPRLGKVPSITEALEVLRSKGVRVVLGAQGIDQIEEVYSKNTARSWSTQTATKIIGRTTEPESQKWASSMVGERALERYAASQTAQSGGGNSVGSSYQRVQEYVVMPAQFGQIVKVTKRGPRAILQIAGSEHVGLLDWHFANLKTIRKGRDECQAAWVLPRYERPIWGTVPPKVAAVQQAKPAVKTAEDEEKEKAKKAGADKLNAMAIQVAERHLGIVPTVDAEAGSDGVGGQVEEMVADHIIAGALDAAMTGGAGSLFELMKGVSELAGNDGGVEGPATVVTVLQEQTAGKDYDDEFE